MRSTKPTLVSGEMAQGIKSLPALQDLSSDPQNSRKSQAQQSVCVTPAFLVRWKGEEAHMPGSLVCRAESNEQGGRRRRTPKAAL